jgi:hypothetical protein
MDDGEWEIRVTNELLAWIGTLDERTRAQVVDAIDRLAEAGPALGRPLVDSIAHSSVHNLKELRPGSAGRSEVRIMFAFECATRRCQYRMGVGDPRRWVVVAA